MTQSHLLILPFCPTPFLTGIWGIPSRENSGIKVACRRVLEPLRHEHQHVLNFIHPQLPYFCPFPGDFRIPFCVSRGAFGRPCGEGGGGLNYPQDTYTAVTVEQFQ